MSDEQAGSLNKVCSDYRCSQSIAVSANQWPDDLHLSDIELRFLCEACGKRGADVRPDFNWNKQPNAMRDMGVRGILVYCADYRCSHSIAISRDGWPDDVRQSDYWAAVCVPPRVEFGLIALNSCLWW